MIILHSGLKITLLPVKDWSRGCGLPEQRLEVMNYTDTTIAEDDPFVGVAACT